MTKVVGVRFRQAGKVYYFDPLEYNIEQGSNVIVETARGIEFGHVVMGVREVEDEKVVQPLKPIIRPATEDDEKQEKANREKEKNAFKICLEKIANRGLEMKLIGCEYTFDSNKVLFYFTADGRVDFRELVKDLAAVFRMRIELRQIGVRDEAKMLGGIGSCGRPLCCHSWLTDFEPVSIKMAKVQNLSLNPTKISGICGRLMCCLKYENDIYIELKRGLPDLGERVKTPDGMAKVVDTSVLEGKVKVRLYVEGDNQADGEDKLSADIFTYTKEEIRRIEKRSKKKQEDIFQGVNAEELKELEKLILD